MSAYPQSMITALAAGAGAGVAAATTAATSAATTGAATAASGGAAAAAGGGAAATAGSVMKQQLVDQRRSWSSGVRGPGAMTLVSQTRRKSGSIS